MNTELQAVEWITKQYREAFARRDWTKLPQDFEAQAVAKVYVQINKHIDRRDIKQRIAFSKATSFADALAVFPCSQ